VSERSIEVPDPDVPVPPQPAGESPYRNLLVPLVVVPFLVVVVLVLVFVFFGQIAGSESSIEDNLDRVVHGGSNESKQAAMSLGAQAVDNAEARFQRKPEPWPVGPDFQRKLAAAWDDLDPEDVSLRLAVAQVSAIYGDPAALERLQTFLGLSDQQDPGSEARFSAIIAMSWLDDPRVADVLIPMLRHDDPFWRLTAAGALQRVPGPRTTAALSEVLDDPSLELRGTAAVSLAQLGDPRGARVLRELVERAPYEALRRTDPRKFASEKLIQSTRVTAVEALAQLALAEDKPLFERLAADEQDPLVREAAMRASQRP
jgi:HEAT repeat protein